MKLMFDRFHDNDTIWEKIQYKYWDIWPYNWRPGEAWYRLKCFLFKRYTTIKPKTLNYHTWVDRRHLLYHFAFEILTQFIEEECSPGHTDWEKTNHTVEVDGRTVNVRDEMQEIYDWWQNYHVYSDVENLLYEMAMKYESEDASEQLSDGMWNWKRKFKTPEEEEKHNRLMKGTNTLDDIRNKDIDDMLHRLINIRQNMWT